LLLISISRRFLLMFSSSSPPFLFQFCCFFDAAATTLLRDIDMLFFDLPSLFLLPMPFSMMISRRCRCFTPLALRDCFCAATPLHILRFCFDAFAAIRFDAR
jgi:hypothetical protein